MKRIAMMLTVDLDADDERELIERDGPERADRTLEQRVGDAVITALEDIGQDARVQWGLLGTLKLAVARRRLAVDDGSASFSGSPTYGVVGAANNLEQWLKDGEER
jgi:hypothetical protein